ncbi:ribonuclease 3-like protein 3 [Hevea brasiliensis]|uniref:ribonuclease 3-like protein 3 n=1 Tax=Hevea brasiliensis TaxID=3981 RepID=UPI0025CE685A|nr:ribonuclease 3-like protein 3 [Hevea brasiliensis]
MAYHQELEPEIIVLSLNSESNQRLLEEAFTDSSFPDKRISYEWLEHVGDSVLNLLFTKEYYFKYPDLPPGALTWLRAANVNTEKLAHVAIKHGLHHFLRHKKPLREEQVLADIVESLIGAVFIDCNSSIDTVWKNLLEPIISREMLKMHPVTELYDECQKKHLKVKFVDLWRESMAFDVFINDQLVGRGTYVLKKEIAHNRAAKDALDNIGRILGEKDSTDES